MSESAVTEELTTLIRGFFSLPVLAALGRLGFFEGLADRTEISPDDFPDIPNKKLLKHSLDYLSRLGLFETASGPQETYKMTWLGGKIFQRTNSFFVPHSYHDYMENYYAQLMSGDDEKGTVDRLENIIGSGKAHLRYFPHAVSYLKRRVKFERVVDVGCGDGHFLDFLLSSIPVKKAIGVDLSEIAVKETEQKLRTKYPDHEIEMILSDASDVSHWGDKVLKICSGEQLILSLWFLVHEISLGDPQNAVRFLNQVHQRFPQAPLVMCEIVKHEASLIAKHRSSSIMPEYLFFHDISGQGVLSWKMYQEVLKSIPYELAHERRFDEMTGEDGVQDPSAFLWCLTPKS